MTKVWYMCIIFLISLERLTQRLLGTICGGSDTYFHLTTDTKDLLPSIKECIILIWDQLSVRLHYIGHREASRTEFTWIS